MRHKKLTMCIAVTVLFSIVAVLSGFSQEDVKTVQDRAFNPRTMERPPVIFLHDAHNEKAKIEQCSACHHEYKDGKKLEDGSSEGTACSECHKSGDKENPLPLIRAYHLQCKGCHAEKRKGPVMCGECHVTD